ncbi:hypothetical protein J6590_057017 [Homalodisca vitripennis]|nr:hypothetical protein J6590_057017 [Homalodisca vitripennis]
MRSGKYRSGLSLTISAGFSGAFGAIRTFYRRKKTSLEIYNMVMEVVREFWWKLKKETSEFGERLPPRTLTSVLVFLGGLVVARQFRGVLIVEPRISMVSYH